MHSRCHRGPHDSPSVWLKVWGTDDTHYPDTSGIVNSTTWHNKGLRFQLGSQGDSESDGIGSGTFKQSEDRESRASISRVRSSSAPSTCPSLIRLLEINHHWFIVIRDAAVLRTLNKCGNGHFRTLSVVFVQIRRTNPSS